MSSRMFIRRAIQKFIYILRYIIARERRRFISALRRVNGQRRPATACRVPRETALLPPPTRRISPRRIAQAAFLVQQGQAALTQRRKDLAYHYFSQAVQWDPTSAAAWFGKCRAARSPAEKMICLKQARKIDLSQAWARRDQHMPVAPVAVHVTATKTVPGPVRATYASPVPYAVESTSQRRIARQPQAPMTAAGGPSLVQISRPDLAHRPQEHLPFVKKPRDDGRAAMIQRLIRFLEEEMSSNKD
jgi:hypothetical protein